MTSREIKEAGRPAWGSLIAQQGKSVAQLPTHIKEDLREAMLALQADEDKADAARFFDEMFFPAGRK